MTVGRAASVHARLLNLARERGVDPNRILERYALERWLYRLSISNRRDALCLKGALLFDLWFHAPQRPTRDADFLGFGLDDAEAPAALVHEVSAIHEDDGLVFDASDLHMEEIREEARYGGLRVRFFALLGSGRIPVQLDVGTGDVITPSSEIVDYPTLLTDSPAPRLSVYPRETVVAEKLETMVSLGMVNSRMKDYYDVWVLAREGAMSGELLGAAIAATFKRRDTVLPRQLPAGLSREFSLDPIHQKQWRAFLEKNRLTAPTLEKVVSELGEFIGVPLGNARTEGE